MDAGARGEAKELNRPWGMPEVWTEEGSVFLHHGDRAVIRVRKFLMEPGHKMLEAVTSGDRVVERRPWARKSQESAMGWKQWAHLQPLPLQEYYPLRAWALYAMLPQWELLGEGGVCDMAHATGVPCQYPLECATDRYGMIAF